ncbi:hypothetical protein A2V82_12170 [candidate division KSB1 bacterium RBG_16_48_16]|nr:MAG: hypothetical protein A2V82_12170 [candidate division KSB1 bacterium RBG_16_48_16]
MKRRIKKHTDPAASQTGYAGYINLKTGLGLSAVILLLINLFVLDNVPKMPRRARDLATRDVRVYQVLKNVMQEYNIRERWQRTTDGLTEVTIPENFQFLNMYGRLDQELGKIGYRLLDCLEDSRRHLYEMNIGNDSGIVHRLTFVVKESLPGVAGYVAIIIDDFGYKYDELTKEFINFSRPLTISIIPGLRETQRIRRDAELAQKEVLIHIPMEPLEEKYDKDDYILLTDMPPSEIHLRMQKALAEIPNAVGVNNHQGSKATADENLMTVVLSEIKAANKFFIDSRTNSESLAYDVAKKMGVPTAANQVFIDAKDDVDFITQQMARLGEMAGANGRVIGIGHVRKNTFKVLTKMIPELEARGIEFVFVSSFTG